MKRLIPIVFLLCTPVLADEQQRIEQSRHLAMELQQQLSSELMSAMKAQGPVHAIAVCNERAPEIAKGLSSNHNAVVGRTALRVRNPNNAPMGEHKAVMDYFQARLAKDPNTVPEVLFTASNGEQHYMRAIPMQPQCAACHGSNIKPEVSHAIAQKYPYDKATGFEVGDLRGSFLIRWIAE
ncbi:Tll0287-like domain-containing protein [Pseudidiomarina donghaiensis]|uniref:Tll0287-like domain-containing protein n=1 Tax=Pseudidiomarina donghaiensis TaxID=519452 RepID=UPI003A98809F